MRRAVLLAVLGLERVGGSGPRRGRHAGRHWATGDTGWYVSNVIVNWTLTHPTPSSWMCAATPLNRHDRHKLDLLRREWPDDSTTTPHHQR